MMVDLSTSLAYGKKDFKTFAKRFCHFQVLSLLKSETDCTMAEIVKVDQNNIGCGVGHNFCRTTLKTMSFSLIFDS